MTSTNTTMIYLLQHIYAVYTLYNRLENLSQKEAASITNP